MKGTRRPSPKKHTKVTLTNQNLCLNVSHENEAMPDPVLLPPIEYVSNLLFEFSMIIIFDLETTSLFDDCDITQISATTLDMDKILNQYILPNKTISSAATQVTSLTEVTQNLFHKGKPVPSLSFKEGLLAFYEWLASIGESIILLVH